MITFKYASNVISPNGIGMVNFSNSIIGYFSLFAALGVSSYAIREGARIRNEKESIEEFASEVFTLNVLSSLVAYIALFLCIYFIDYLHMYLALLLIQSLTILFTTLGTEWINSIYEDYFYICIRTIVVQIISIVLMFLFVKNEDDYLIYAIISMISQTGMYVFNILYVKKYVRFKLKFLGIKKHLKPILIIFSTSVAIYIYVSICTTMIGFIKGNYSVAMYSAISKIYTAVKTVFSTVITVMIPRLSYYCREKITSYNSLLEKTINLLIVLLVPCCILLFFYSDYLILFASGYEYLQSSLALKILAIAIIPSTFSTFITNAIFLVKRNEFYSLVATIFGAISNFVLNIYFIEKFDFTGAAITTLISEIIVLIICMICCTKEDGISILEKKLFSNILKCVIGGSVFAISYYISGLLFDHYIVILLFGSTLFGILYIALLLILKNEIVVEYFYIIISRFKRYNA